MSREAYTDWSRLFRPAKDVKSPAADPEKTIMGPPAKPEPELEPIFVTSNFDPQTFFSKVDKDKKLSYLSM